MTLPSLWTIPSAPWATCTSRIPSMTALPVRSRKYNKSRPCSSRDRDYSYLLPRLFSLEMDLLYGSHSVKSELYQLADHRLVVRIAVLEVSVGNGAADGTCLMSKMC